MFTVPAYAVDAGGNISIAPAVSEVTFSLPAETVSSGSQISPAAQVATFTLPQETVTIIRSIIISVATQLLAFSIPTLQKFGGVWAKRTRPTNSTWSRRSVNDD